MITLLKLGGSLITDKNAEQSFNAEVVQRLASEIRAALDLNTDLKLIIGHGSGSFGHFEASKHQTANGVQTQEDWLGFAHVAHAAATLNHLVAGHLIKVGIPVMRTAPSAIACAEDKALTEMHLANVYKALDHRLVPLIYGDVVFDAAIGGTIASTEMVLGYLATHLPVSRILLLGEVDGVLDSRGSVIPLITPHTLREVQDILGQSRGVDVTGGMRSKVQDMLELVLQQPQIEVWICNGLREGLLQNALVGRVPIGTRVQA